MNPRELDSQRLERIGYDSCVTSCGNFLVLDQEVVDNRCTINGLRVVPLMEAFSVFPHMRERLYFNLIRRDMNELTALASREDPVGYYVYVEPGVKVEEPLQAAFLFGLTGSTQKIHNIIELGEGSELNIVNGCTTLSTGDSGTHVGITETYVGKDAHLGYTMLHNWGDTMEVYPVGAVQVAENGRYISNYVAMTSVKKIVSCPVAKVLSGGSARFYSIIYAREGSFFDTGSKVVLEGEGSSGEILSRVVSEGGTVISRQMLTGCVPKTRGHMECSGLLLNDHGVIHSIPEIRGEHPDISLSHEAAVGRISDEELSYLRMRGLTEEQSRSLIIRG
ncbi:MAG: SufD family Fe-S cluster assembly protein, partial [Desulfomonilia bacterium]|nr:SufD family Fe-S cluster assembly protein [Desulfomonilia bacterium]